MTGALHRVGQFWRHASASVSDDEQAHAARVLGPELTPLFLELPVNDRRHGLDVLETVCRLHTEPDIVLQQAALVHDAGKSGAGFSVIDRSLTVLLKATWPALLSLLSRLRPGFAERLRVYEEHATIGAERLRRLGAARLADIVAEHHDRLPVHAETRKLQEADRRH